MNELHLFAGAGGGILGGELLGHTCVCAVEIEEYPRKVLFQRQRDGLLPQFPIWDDITTFDGRPWKGRADIVSGGFPCQDISASGKGAGIDGERSGLWGEMARVVDEVRPRFVFVENSPMLTSRGLGNVLADLAKMGYDARWCVLGGYDLDGPIQRDRIWILGFQNASANEELGVDSESTGQHQDAEEVKLWSSASFSTLLDDAKTRLPIVTGDERVVDDVAYNVDRFKAVGNGQVPAVAATAFTILSEGLI